MALKLYGMMRPSLRDFQSSLYKTDGAPMYTAVSRVLSCLYEKDAEFDFVPVDVAAGEHKQPSYLSENPFGAVPVLEDGDLTLFESRAVTKYISYKYKDQGPDLLRMHDLAESSMVNVWMEVESQSFNAPISTIVDQGFIESLGGTPDEELLKTNVEKLGKVLDVYEDRLSKCKYLAGDFFSLADLHHQPSLYYMMMTPSKDLINSRPHVKKWWEYISSRAAFRLVYQRALWSMEILSGPALRRLGDQEAKIRAAKSKWPAIRRYGEDWDW